MGEMRRAIAREDDDRRKQDRFASTLDNSASIIAAVRLARDDNQPAVSQSSIGDHGQRSSGEIHPGCDSKVTKERNYVRTIW